MKKISFLLTALIITLVSCDNSSTSNTENPAGNGKTFPNDSAKIDTLRGADTIIKG